MIINCKNLYKASVLVLLFISVYEVCGDAESELRAPGDLYSTADILLDVADGKATYNIDDYAQALLINPDLIEALDIALFQYSCDALKNLLQAIQCQKNLASEEIKNNFEEAINSPDLFDVVPCLEPYKDECIVANLEEEVKNLEITDAEDVEKAVDVLATAINFGNSTLVEDILINVANADKEGIEKTSKVIKGIVSQEGLKPAELLKTFDGVLNKDMWSASVAVRSGIATAIEENTYSDNFIEALALEIKQQLSTSRRRSLLQGTPELCRQLLLNEVTRAIRENMPPEKQCDNFRTVYKDIRETVKNRYDLPESELIKFVVYDQTLCPCLGITECQTDTAPLVQVYILTDATGSMSPYIENVKSSAEVMLEWLTRVYGNLDIAVGSYRDCTYGSCSGDNYYYNLELDFTPVDQITKISDAIQQWEASGGGDFPEAQLYALDQIGKYDKWSDDAAKLLIWFGDAPGKQIEDVTLDMAYNSISSKDIVVFAVDLAKMDEKGEATKIVGDNGWLIEGTEDLDVTLGSDGVGVLQLTGFAAQVTQFIIKFVECNSQPGSA